MAETIGSTVQHNTSSSIATPDKRGDLESQRQEANQQMRPDVEAERRQVQQQAEKTLDSGAIAAVQQTQRAARAIAEQRTEEALGAIEQATGKIQILLSRNPKTALIPVNFHTFVIDTAPQSSLDINFLVNAADIALDIHDLPTARAALDALRSEIRLRTYNLPLATYPTALQEAARLLDQKKTREAGDVILSALNTLVAIDQVTPIPLLLAKRAINEAQAQAEKDKGAAQKLLETASNEVKRAMDLGYAAENPEYKSLRDEIRALQKQLKGEGETASVFSKLKQKLASLTRRQSERKIHSDPKEHPHKAA